MIRVRALLSSLPIGAALLTGCSADGSASNATPGCPHPTDAAPLAGPRVTASSNEARVKVVNGYCPVSGNCSIGEGRMTVTSLTRDFRGRKIGFCCADCLPVWDRLSDPQKQTALDAAAANEKKDQDAAARKG